MEKNYIKTRPKTVIDITRIVTIHYYEFGQSFVFSGESHDFWEMVYVDKGSVAVRRDNEEEFILTQGNVLFHKPNEFHAIRAYESSPNFFVISFVSSSMAMVNFERFEATLDKVHKSLVSEIIKEAEKCYIIPKNETELKKLIRQTSPPLGSEQLIKSYLELLLIYLMRTKKKTQDIPVLQHDEHEPLIGAIKEYILSRCEENIRVDEICRAFGYSKSFLSRFFKEHTGESLASYASKMKINKAKELLRNSNMNITQISLLLSFENPQYFARAFKRQCGMTPTEWRRRAHV